MPSKMIDATTITAFNLLFSNSLSATFIVWALNILETHAKSRIKIADFLDMTQKYFLKDVNKNVLRNKS